VEVRLSWSLSQIHISLTLVSRFTISSQLEPCRIQSPECDGSYGDGTTVHFSRRTECDGGSGHDGAFNNGVDFKGDGRFGQNGAFNKGIGSEDDDGSSQNGALKKW
jgi:hypothetical protein